MIKKRVRRLYIGNSLITPEQRISNGGVLCQNEHILALGGVSGFSFEEEVEVFRFDDREVYITPGFIDTHIHGAGGFDCSSVHCSPRPIDEMSRILGERGVTGFFPTVVAAERGEMLENLSLLAHEMRRTLPGADPIAINIEGPFLNPLKCGAQKESVISAIDLGFARELVAAGDGLVKLMTFAPELDNSIELIEQLCEAGVTPSMGHSLADEEQALRAIDAGACHCTHLFNGMAPLHQRNIGLVGIALTDRRVAVELIIDGKHIHPRMVDLACRCKRVSRIIGISDGTMAAGMPNGNYRIGPTEIQVKDGFSQTSDGKLAGTTTMLDTGWHSLMSCGHLSEVLAAQTVTQNPAEAFGFHDRGVLLPTKRADLAIFESGTNRPILTVRRGEIIHREGI